MSDIARVSPEKVREKVRLGNALLVCAYDDDGKYGRMRLDGSLSLGEFKSKIAGLPKDKEIIFF